MLRISWIEKKINADTLRAAGVTACATAGVTASVARLIKTIQKKNIKYM